MTAHRFTAEDFPVGEHEFAEVTAELIESVTDADPAKQKRPTLVFIGGQPGSGKSRTVSAREASLGAAVVVDSDELRKLHPRIRDIAAADPLRMDVLSNGPVPAWTRTFIDAARERRRNVIIENTFARPDAMIAEAGRFRDSGYRVVADAIITAPAASRLGIVDRYRRAAEAGEIARWTTENAHTTAVDNIAGTIDELLRSGAVELVNMHTRSGPLGIAVTSPGDAVGIIDDIRPAIRLLTSTPITGSAMRSAPASSSTTISSATTVRASSAISPETRSRSSAVMCQTATTGFAGHWPTMRHERGKRPSPSPPRAWICGFNPMRRLLWSKPSGLTQPPRPMSPTTSTTTPTSPRPRCCAR